MHSYDEKSSENKNVAMALYAMANELSQIANALNRLGFADASTPMGALEAHGALMAQAAKGISSSLDGIASAIGYAADTPEEK